MFEATIAEISANSDLFHIEASITVIIITIIILYQLARSIEKKFGVQKIPINENLYKIVSNNWQYLPTKWFDWLKWIIIIGGISIIGKDAPSRLVELVIIISYIAIALDSYRTSYLFAQTFFISIYYFIDSLDKSSDSIIPEDHKKSMDRLKLYLGVIGFYLTPLEYTKERRETVIVGNETIEEFKKAQSRLEKNRRTIVEARKIVNVLCAFIAIAWTYIIYILVSNIVDLYTG